jgi:hypothetical protein
MEKREVFGAAVLAPGKELSYGLGALTPSRMVSSHPWGERARSISAKERATMVRPTETGERQVSAHALSGLTERSGTRAGIRALGSSEELCNSIIR